VEAVTHFNDAKILDEVSKSLGEPMVGIGVSELPENARLASRGW
jgi:pyridoxal 5'-phosphate synthase pdxS subunit